MFTHLHVHSPYSFLDGASSIEDLVIKAANLGMRALAITDHNNLSASVRFIKTATKYGIKPIIGSEITIDGGHLTVLCENKEGYKNLCKILTEAHLGNPRGQPSAAFSSLARHKEGLILLTGCRRGLVPSLLLRKRFSEAESLLRKYKDLFGKEKLFVELPEMLLPGSLSLARHLKDLSEVLGLKVVATNNVHYANKEDFKTHDALTCIRTLTTLEDVHPERRLNAENYLKSQKEMEEEFKEYPEAIKMTEEIAFGCQVPLELGVPNFPLFTLPEGYSSSKEFLRRLVRGGAISRYGKITPSIESRLQYELKIIETLGYEDYFLVVWDLVKFAENKEIRHAGRGSAADSAVAFCLGITDVDPIAQNLLFERFLSVERGEKPDIDIDFDARRRDEVTAYVYEKYGSERVASVATYNTFQGRSSIRDAGKVMGYSPDEIDILAKRLPYMRVSLEDAFKVFPELSSINIPKSRLSALIEMAQRLEGLPRFLSTHLGGVVISRSPVTDLSPIERSAKGVTIMEFDKDDVEDLGLVKIDLLSLRTLGAVQDAVEFSSRHLAGNNSQRDPVKRVDYLKIPLNDQATFQRLASGDTVGVFQLESPAQRALQSRLGAKDIEDIVASVALIRPGPIKGNMVEPFINRRKGSESISYLDPRLEPILKKTYGVILFQEQVIEIASVIGGFTPGEADKLRRVMTHGRSLDEMTKLGELFVKKAFERGVQPEVAKKIFSMMQGYASYGFCEAHARAFGTTAYKTAYLIQHHPQEFYAAILNNQPMGFYPVSTICVEARRHGVKILGPSINHSEKDVSLGKDPAIPEIYLGFKMIKEMSEKAIFDITSERKMKGPFRSFSDFEERIKVDSASLRSLILCGAFDELGYSRQSLMWMLERSKTLDSSKPLRAKESQLFYEDEALLMQKGTPGHADFSLADKVGFEYEILGTGISAHPMEIWRNLLKEKGFVQSSDLKGITPGDFIKVGGIPVRPHRPPTKSGKIVVFLSLEDETGLIDITCFENVYKRYAKLLFSGDLIPLGVWGQLSKRGQGLSVTARTIFPLSYVISPSSGWTR